MKYFRAVDDVGAPGRWFLGEVTDLQTGRALHLLGAVACSSDHATVEITTVGRPLPFTETGFGVPIISTRLVGCFDGLSDQVQLVRLETPTSEEFFAVNVLARVACVDELRSGGVLKWGSTDGRADRLGQYRMITDLVLDEAKVPQGIHCFRVEGWSVALVVSETLKTRLEAAGCEGAVFTPVGR